jgi:hypothetical protein
MADAAVNRQIRVFHLLDVHGQESGPGSAGQVAEALPIPGPLCSCGGVSPMNSGARVRIGLLGTGHSVRRPIVVSVF